MIRQATEEEIKIFIMARKAIKKMIEMKQVPAAIFMPKGYEYIMHIDNVPIICSACIEPGTLIVITREYFEQHKTSFSIKEE